MSSNTVWVKRQITHFRYCSHWNKYVLPSSSSVISFRPKRNDRNDLFNSNDMYKKKKLTTRFPITTVARKKGTQTYDATHMQTHMDSIHSPHKTRNTIMKLCIKSTKFQRGISLFKNLSMLSEKILVGIMNVAHFDRNENRIWNWVSKTRRIFSLTYITFAEQLHAHDGKYENDNAQHESKVSQSSDGFTHDWYKQV